VTGNSVNCLQGRDMRVCSRCNTFLLCAEVSCLLSSHLLHLSSWASCRNSSGLLQLHNSNLFNSQQRPKKGRPVVTAVLHCTLNCLYVWLQLQTRDQKLIGGQNYLGSLKVDIAKFKGILDQSLVRVKHNPTGCYRTLWDILQLPAFYTLLAIATVIDAILLFASRHFDYLQITNKYRQKYNLYRASDSRRWSLPVHNWDWGMAEVQTKN